MLQMEEKMGVIDELARRLKSAQRAATQARKEWIIATQTSADARKKLDAAEARVAELEQAISILRNNLRPAAPTDGTVTQLIRK